MPIPVLHWTILNGGFRQSMWVTTLDPPQGRRIFALRADGTAEPRTWVLFLAVAGRVF